MAYDNFRGYVVGYAGFTGWGAGHNDSDSHGYAYGTWMWSGATSNWVAINSLSSISRFAPAMTYDAGVQDGYLLVLGGANFGGYYSTEYVFK
jgi:hypothetical protein